MRDKFYGPGSRNFNSALYKDFRITERIKVTFRWEQYNTLNHPNWSGPNTTPTSASFGKITAKSGNRDQQLALDLGLTKGGSHSFASAIPVLK